ncbi:MAG: hypothetical protein QOF51_3600 [Chloroflexota bacterium]|jgi:hypothetical protein|nr:hypothetical protein [Chloroflexota bacterium]
MATGALRIAAEEPSPSERPLRLRDDVPLTARQTRILAALAAYDLTVIRARLLKDGVMPATWVDEAILEFRRYLALRLFSDRRTYVCSKQVDTVWHAAILDTRLYADFCARTFGEFIHHHPEEAPIDATTWRDFEVPYSRLFGQPGRIWERWHPSPAIDQA